MDTKYSFSMYFRGNQQEVSERMVVLEQEHGKLTAEIVLAEAKNPDSPLHNCWDWNIEEAAEKWFLEQSRKLIQCIVMVTDVPNAPPIRAFVHIGEEERYVSTTRAASDMDLREKMMANARREISQLKVKYKALDKFCIALDKANELLNAV